MRDRTADLLRAKQALSQLSYSPIYFFHGLWLPQNFSEDKAKCGEAYTCMRVTF